MLDGFSKIPELVGQAKALGMQHLAITDHGAMYGVIDFFNAAKEQDIHPIIGMEAYLAARGMQDRDSELDKHSSHLLLLAETQEGYQNLLKIASRAQLDGFYYYPRIDHEFLAQHAKGLIATTGCLSAEIPRAILREKIDEARQKLDWYYEVFGPNNFYFELQDHPIEELGPVNRVLKDLGGRYQANFVATNDVHYIRPEDARLQDILLCVQTGSRYGETKRMRMSGTDYYLRSEEEMQTLFAGQEDALRNTVLIAERCQVDLSTQGYHLPEFEVPEGYDEQSYMRMLCEEGLRRRYPGREDDAVIRERMEYELSTINEMNFNAYFLIVWDLCRFAKEKNIWYNARGSAAGSIVAYALDITLVDPLEHNLIFERFLNRDRVSMPDIDLDFQDDKRYLMLEYCRQRYGEDKVAAIITFNKLKARAAVRDVGRVLDVPLPEVDRIAKLIPNIPGKPVTIAEALETVPDFAREYNSNSQAKELIDTAQQVEGVIRGAGTHAAGVVISDERPIMDYVPLNRPTGNNAEETPIKQLTQFEMTTLDSLGLLKVDFLGLTTLTIMQRACDLIAQRHGTQYDLDNIPLDDAATFELLGRGETAGVFQFEGAGMRRWMVAMKPHLLENAVAMVALFRPGPMDFIPTYINRMHGKEPVSYAHPALESIFAETYGIPVYQEQLMSAVMQVAGYTASEADDLRKAIAKKIEEKLRKHRKKFVDGATKQGIESKTAEQIFSDWENFARYGFNKAHAADYGVLAVQTAYLKTHYPVEYMTALLSVTLTDTDKVAYYIQDCRRMEIDVLPPDVNVSGWDFSIRDGEDKPAIRFGLGAIKNVGHGPVMAILAGRGDKPFADLVDFGQRVDLRQVGKRALECLVKSGAMDTFGSRHAMLDVIDQLVAMSAELFHAKEVGQLTLFGGDAGGPQVVLPRIAQGDEEATRRERLNWERELIGLYLSDHPLTPLLGQLKEVVTHFSSDLVVLGGEERVRVAGMVKNWRSFPTKRGQMMAFVTIEDPYGVIDTVVFPSVWERSGSLVGTDKLVIMEGKLDPQNGETKVLVDKIENNLNIVGPMGNQTGAAPAPPAAPAPGPEAKQASPTMPPPPSPASGAVAEPPDDFDLGDLPEPPEAFPPGWELAADDHYPLTGHTSPPQVDERQPELPVEPPATPAGAQHSFGNAQDKAAPAAAADPPAPSVGAKHASPDSTTVTEDAFPAFIEPAPAMARPTQPAADPSVPVEPAANAPTLQEQEAEPADTPAPVPQERETAPAVDAPVPQEREAATQLPQGSAAQVAGSAVGAVVYPTADSAAPPSARAAEGAAPAEGGAAKAPRMLTVYLRGSGDKQRDILAIRRVHGAIISFPGEDRFAFQVFEGRSSYLLDFPNDTTGLNEELLARLEGMVGANNFRVEQITLQ
ncbi:MAG: DNA polymerase III subunit alpha [Anaerolineales bacterium]|nr:DNA polymerase III subunit alpha [Anaerolineales bacterium]